MDAPETNPWEGFEVISRYTRAEAIADGTLVDLMDGESAELVRQAGFRWPIAMTATAFQEYVWPLDDTVAAAKLKALCQDWKGRLWDVLWMLRCAIRSAPTGGTELLFKLRVRNPRGRLERVTLKCVTGPGDDAEPVMTIMLPEED